MRLFASKRKPQQLGRARVARGKSTDLRAGKWATGNPKNSPYVA